MKCHECEELLQKRMDGDGKASSAAIEQHLSECAACREQHTAALRLLDGLKQLSAPKLAPDFAKALTAKVMQDRRHRQEKMRRRVVLTMALAASVMLMLAFAYFWVPRMPPLEPRPNENLAHKKDELKNVPVPKQHEDEKPTLKEEPRHPLAALPERMESTTRDYAKVVLAAADLDGMGKLPVQNLPPLNPGMREVGQEFSDGVRVVSRNASRAFGFFVREMPLPEFAAKGD